MGQHWVLLLGSFTLQKNVVQSPGGGLFIGNPNHMYGLLRNLNPYIREACREKQMYTY